MTQVAMTMTLDPSHGDDLVQHIRSELVPWVRRLPGFRSGRWVRSVDGGFCLALLDFATEADARYVAELAVAERGNQTRSWRLERVVVADEVAATAAPPVFH